MDHPRSRGVYLVAFRFGWDEAGSSPLARGLLDHHRVLTAQVGIIPARAGFTRDRAHAHGPALGSSPLARGLLNRLLREGDYLGIIPARAGFTAGPSRREWSPSDHPRSRGVYAAPFYPAAYFVGSSPLARGLHLEEMRKRPIIGIIPARAGFTAALSRSVVPAPDHPRSRGVYSASCATGA